MCGLVGMMGTTIASDKQLKLLAQLLYVDQIRGEHATGIAKIQPASNTVAIHKAAVNAAEFLVREDTKEFLNKDRGRIYLGHNRYATMGDKTKDENAHPFQHEHITLVHNGGVDSWTRDKLEGHGEVEVDSHQVCIHLAKHGVEDLVAKFSGAAAFIWWNSEERSLNFLRNKERPLWMAGLNDGTLVWASEKEFLDFFILHKKSQMSYRKDFEPTELPTNTLITYKFSQFGVLESSKPTARDIEFKRVADPSPSRWQDYYPSYGGRRSHVNYSADAYDSRTRALLKWHGHDDVRVGQRIIMEVLTIEKTNSQSEAAEKKCNVYLEYEGILCESFWEDRAKVEGSRFLSGKLTNVTEQTVKGKAAKELLFTVTDLQRHFPSKKSEEKPAVVTSVIGNQFPLKVHGHTFVNQSEFRDFVSKGCSMCGNIPLPSNANNKSMAVYPDGDSPSGLLKDMIYVCGGCVTESEKGNK